MKTGSLYFVSVNLAFDHVADQWEIQVGALEFLSSNKLH